jgi:hypothetical protein
MTIYTVTIHIEYIDYDVDGEWKEIEDIILITSKKKNAMQRFDSVTLEEFFSGSDVEYQTAAVTLETRKTTSNGDFIIKSIEQRSLI